jgi:hypothetical protein
MGILTSRHLVALAGPEGCGKKAGTLALARAGCPDAESFTVFPPTRSLAELASYKRYRQGQVYLLHDWMPVSTDPSSVASFDVDQLTSRLSRVGAYLAITFEGATHLRVFGDIGVTWQAPEAGTLLDHCVHEHPKLDLSEADHQRLHSCVARIRSPRLVIRLVESAVDGVESAIAEADESENTAVAHWFEPPPARWLIRAVMALTFLSGVGEREFERQLSLLTESALKGTTPPPDDEQWAAPDDDAPFPQVRWALANEANLGSFISERDPAAAVGAEHRPAFRTKASRLHFMTELNRRYGDDLWSPVRDWLFTLADQPFGEPQIAAGYGLALLARLALFEVEDTYLTPWSAGELRHRLMTVSVLWAMAEDDVIAPAALRIAVSWVLNRGQERAIAAALAFGGPLGQRYPSEAMRWLWALSQRSERIGRFARTAMSQLFAVESEADQEKSTVLRFLVQKVRAALKPDVTVRERRAALAVVNSVLATTQTLSERPAVVGVLRSRPADLRPAGELWAAVLNSGPHRRPAVKALYSALAAVTDGPDSVRFAAQLGTAILPRLTPRALEVLKLALPDPVRAEEVSASVVAAFLGAQNQAIGVLT